MEPGAKNPKVDSFLRASKSWQNELKELRRIILDCQLTEEVKWRHPCYTAQGNNVIIIGGFKEYCVISFLKGALLKDPKGVLEKTGENTQAARVIRFTNVEQIVKLEPVLKAYILEAVAAEKAGLKVAFKKTKDFAFPAEFQKKLDELPKLKAAFDALTPGRQRGYLLHFSGAKQSVTRESRVAKCMPRILKGKGLDD
jgi:uncharacterized protein YdeI (YjbR/CyaY-like superfamily)